MSARRCGRLYRREHACGQGAHGGPCTVVGGCALGWREGARRWGGTHGSGGSAYEGGEACTEVEEVHTAIRGRVGIHRGHTKGEGIHM
jgi:hypothetical protein